MLRLARSGSRGTRARSRLLAPTFFVLEPRRLLAIDRKVPVSGCCTAVVMARSSSDGGAGRFSRADKLLGHPSSSSYNYVHDTDAVSELNEEDVWDLGTDGSQDDVSAHESMRADSTDSYRMMNSGRRWKGIEKEPGLSVAFADSSRAYGLSPHKLVGGYANYSGQSASREGRGVSTAVRMIPPIAQIRENSPRPMMHQSAPVNVPDWTKILGAEKKSSKWADDVSDSDKEDAVEERLPPHLQIQREYAQSQMTTFSVCEGAGRTLKGRDLSRVRNAVLRQTGFLDG